jgi:TrpR-related protein YerC/YecD
MHFLKKTNQNLRLGVFDKATESLTSLLYFAKVMDMLKQVSSVLQTEQAKQLASALVAIDDVKTMQNFLRDVMTEKEITEVGARLEAAKMLQSGAKYTEIIAKTKLSSRTVARISDWMQNGMGGYEAVLKTEHHSHILPARAA